MKEEWRNIEGFDGRYQVSNLGHVKSTLFANRSCQKKRDKIIAPENNGRGYLVVGLYKDGKRTNKYVHRLVADAFCERRGGRNYVNHLDHDTLNNNSLNLEWCTARENIHHSSTKMKRNTAATTDDVCIYKRGYWYRVVVNGKEYKQQRSLEEARALRDEIIKEMDGRMAK